MRKGTRKHYLKYRDTARAVVHERIEYFNRFYGYKYGRIFIRNTRTRWGSCSEKKNLNFNYKITLLPEEIRDYVIVHELCHLKEFNHSAHFWALVAETFPHYREMRRRLRAIERDSDIKKFSLGLLLNLSFSTER